MIRLSATTQKLQAVLTAAVAANQPVATVNFSDHTSTTYNGGTQRTALNSTTAVDICDAPGASTYRDIDYITIYNKDTTNVEVQVMVDVSATDYEIVKITLSAKDTLQYVHGAGWSVISAAGEIKNGFQSNILYAKTEGTATASQTSITGLVYTPGYVDVIINGVTLAPSDVTATNGTSVTVPAMTLGDSYVVVAWKPSATIADAIPVTTADAKGDLIVGSAADAVDNLTVGANDTMLMAASGQTLGVKWGTPTEVGAALAPAWTSFSPTITADSGTPTTTSSALYYSQIGKTVHVAGIVTVTDKGTATNGLQIALPVAGKRQPCGGGSAREIAAVGTQHSITCNTTTATMWSYLNGTPWVNGYSFYCAFTYEAA